jgi:hypothetical protein
MKKIDSYFKSNSILLVKTSPRNYKNAIRDFIEFSKRKKRKTCYITLNFSYITLEKKFCSDCDNIFYIDAVTSNITSFKGGKKNINVLFAPSINSLTDINILFRTTMKKNIDFVIFDSLSTLFIYENPIVSLKFVHNIITTMRLNNIKGVFLVHENDVSKELMEDLSSFADKSIFYKSESN